MINQDFDIFEKLDDYIFVASQNGDILFQNTLCIKFFGKIKNFNKIKHYFESSLCVIASDRFSISFTDLILASSENFHSYCTYQTSTDEYYDLSVDSYRYGDFIVVAFRDETQNLVNMIRSEQLSSLQKKYDKLLDNVGKINKLKEDAQQHALQTALINRVFAKIRKSVDKENLIKTVISEVHELLGSYKTYYVELRSKDCKIKSVNSPEFKSSINSKVIFDDETLKTVKEHKIYASVCLKESLDSNETLRRGTRRVVIPMSDGKKTIGAIVSLTVQTTVVKANFELLQTISEQLTGAVIRTLLTENIKKQNKKLQKTLEELEKTQLQLINSEKLASLGQLVAGVAHEINTPLASINSNNEMLKRIIDKGKLSESSEIVKELNAIDSVAVNRISNIVKSLKKFVRLDEAEQQPADINKELDLTLQLINHEVKNKVNVVRDYAELPLVNCHVNMLNQVFMNLLVNACHSIKSNGEIIIKTRVNKKYLVVSIKDNGCGIPDKNKSKIFNVGFTTKGIGAGTGFGLAISKKIVEKHKGTITFKSKEGKGTEFVVKIPCK